MIRFISFLFNKPYETCKSCQTYKEELAYERSEKKELLDTLLKLVSPKVVEQPVVELENIESRSVLFSRRRAELEARDRKEAEIKSSSKNIGIPDSQIAKLETELGIQQGIQKGNEAS